ncbi:hypothetical protein EON63_03135, partial [archaeon]
MKADRGKYASLPNKEIELASSSTKSLTGKDAQQDALERGELLGASKKEDVKPKPKQLSVVELFTILSPYFWPSSSSKDAFINRVRSTSTWSMVAISKFCNIIAPFYLSTATNALV